MIAEGNKHRHVGETLMNKDSSRSHSVLTLYIDHYDNGDTAKMTHIKSKLHLVDLAGSERADNTGATGQQLKEASMINRSLFMLGNVIHDLTAPRRKGAKPKHISYRDSKLTHLLQDSLGGNAITMMICTCSPAAVNEPETKRTLEFADRAKHVKNVAKKNLDPKAALIASLSSEVYALRSENAELRALLIAAGITPPAPGKVLAGGDHGAEEGFTEHGTENLSSLGAGEEGERKGGDGSNGFAMGGGAAPVEDDDGGERGEGGGGGGRLSRTKSSIADDVGGDVKGKVRTPRSMSRTSSPRGASNSLSERLLTAATGGLGSADSTGGGGGNAAESRGPGSVLERACTMLKIQAQKVKLESYETAMEDGATERSTLQARVKTLEKEQSASRHQHESLVERLYVDEKKR